jgi:hypothetical protein
MPIPTRSTNHFMTQSSSQERDSHIHGNQSFMKGDSHSYGGLHHHSHSGGHNGGSVH